MAGAQEQGATIAFHGDVTAERQAEIRAEWADVTAWFERSYGLQEPSIAALRALAGGE